MKKLLSILALIISFQSFSQFKNLNDLEGKTLHNKIRLNYILIHQPVDKVSYNLHPTMGLIGLNYNFTLNDWLYVGAGFHGAITGDQGGLFTLGVNLGVDKKIYKNLYFDANVHFAGGGGYRSLVNSGAMLYTNIGLKYKAKGFALGLQYGNLNFYTGILKGDNVSAFFEIPTTLRYSNYKDAKKSFIVSDKATDDFWKEPAVKNVQQVTFDYFFPIGNTRTDASTTPSYKPISHTLSVLGFEYQRYLTSTTFIYVQADAMYGGLTAGYMDLFFGMGKNFIETKNVNFFGKLAVGASGGRIYPEGGLAIYPKIGFDVKINNHFGVSAHGGYHRAIGGTFEAYTAGFGLKYYGLNGGIKDPFSNQKAKIINTQGISISLQNQTYFDVAKFGIPNSDLQLIAVKLLYDINHRFYINGEASFAYEGKSGGYAHGIFGLGIRSNRFANEKLSLYLEANIGAAGGGRVDTGEGVLIRPNVGINYHIGDDFTFNVSGGKMISPFGNVNSLNLNIGLTYSISILNAKNK